MVVGNLFESFRDPKLLKQSRGFLRCFWYTTTWLFLDRIHHVHTRHIFRRKKRQCISMLQSKVYYGTVFYVIADISHTLLTLSTYTYNVQIFLIFVKQDIKKDHFLGSTSPIILQKGPLLLFETCLLM